jgi:hypothetical protein
VSGLADRVEIETLIDRYLAGIDDSLYLEQNPLDDAWARSLFTEDVVVKFPVGAHEGLDGLAELHRKVMSKWKATLHFAPNRLIEFDGDVARVRAPLVGTHIHREDDPGEPLFAAHVLEAEAVRTGEGWRFRRWTMRLVWRLGDPPAGVTPDES